MGKLTFVTGNKNYSSWSMRPWLALCATRAPFEEIVVPLYVPGYKARLLELSPAGKVPILKQDERVIWDSLAICEFLAEQFPQARLWPEETQARTLARAISAEMHSGFTAIRSSMPFNCRATGRRIQTSAELETEIMRVQAIWRECRTRHGQGGPWLFGHFSVADCMYIPLAMRFVTYGVQLGKVEQAYSDAIQAHPPVQDWIAAARLEKEILQGSEVGL